MLYSLEIPIPANTSREALLASDLQMCAGVIKRVWVRWRFGSARLCGCRIMRESRQIWPTNLTEWFVSCPNDVVFEEYYELSDVPYGVTIEGYNLDDTYPHTLWVAFNVMRPSLSEKFLWLMEQLK